MPDRAVTEKLVFEGVCPLLEVFDMPASLAFYRDVLGFEVVASAPPTGISARTASTCSRRRPRATA